MCTRSANQLQPWRRKFLYVITSRRKGASRVKSTRLMTERRQRSRTSAKSLVYVAHKSRECALNLLLATITRKDAKTPRAKTIRITISTSYYSMSALKPQWHYQDRTLRERDTHTSSEVIFIYEENREDLSDFSGWCRRTRLHSPRGRSPTDSRPSSRNKYITLKFTRRRFRDGDCDPAKLEN